MEEGTSGADRAATANHPPLTFGRIVVVGGGCYGSYYVRQLTRAATAGAVSWTSLIVVDRDPHCQVAQLPLDERPPNLMVETATWADYFSRLLGAAATRPHESSRDAIVPSPLMPHLLAEWVLTRAKERWPARDIRVAPIADGPAVPWQMTGVDHTRFVSFAEWVCPINCIEPARCPATKGERTWSLPSALRAYVENEVNAGRPIEGPFVFHCSHRTYGVGMIDVSAVLAADAAVATLGEHGAAAILLGTASHCHGALQRIEIGPASASAA